MGRIGQLPKSVYEKIAAGEVVEKPASVCKELLENSIDAGASDITLEIQNGGVKYIRITDNGCGIAREDVRLAFQSHATSKLREARDLYAVGTLGFRGEALASVCAVSRTEMLTRTADSGVGTRIVIEGGEEKLLSDAGCPVGTTIIVRDLFYNTPARMKFLKTDRSEGSAVAGVMDRLALSHPEISFRFIKDGKQQLCTPGNGRLQSAIYSVYGGEFTGTLLPVEYGMSGLTVKGYVCKPYFSRGSGAMQLFFVNGRCVKNKTAAAALAEAYKNSVMTGRYPACVLFLTAAPETVDVNVHPAKTEVRFSNEKAVFDAVYYAVKNALQTDGSHPQVSLEKKQRSGLLSPPVKRAVQQSFVLPAFPMPSEPERDGRLLLRDSAQNTYGADSGEGPDLSIRTARTAENDVRERKRKRQSPPEPAVRVADADEAGPPLRILGEAFKTYIFAEYGEKLLIVDKHAAHERLIFDRLKKERGPAGGQLLLSPLSVALSKEEHAVLLENAEPLSRSGFEIEDFGGGSVLVRACPLGLALEELTALLTELADGFLKNRRELLPEKLDRIYHSVACRSAIRAGDETSDCELSRFVRELLENGGVRTCPHGRPVMVELTRYELEKQFGRV